MFSVSVAAVVFIFVSYSFVGSPLIYIVHAGLTGIVRS